MTESRDWVLIDQTVQSVEIGPKIHEITNEQRIKDFSRTFSPG